ncbi:MAG TPA: N-acetyl-gamma-glutamyl-phosphate reductase [Myxococcales bacterium LLY-WYZ-16_1]|nr:N-acetyl-gamma-glutamyl-phosphate reductase [Myxococcales bacterium LLY-WYZ-16_1]
MTTHRAAVLGGTGYGGGEMIRRLLRHPQVELVRVTSIDHVGEPLSAVHPNLEGQTDLRFEQLGWRQAARDVDVVLLGLPHEVSLEAVPELARSEARIVDMSAAFRLLTADAYAERYGRAHPAPDLLPRFVYGLPELDREAIAGAGYVANPGCFATCVQLALAPWVRSGPQIPRAQVVAMTGSSGSGSEPRATTHHPVRHGNLRAYGALRHVQSHEMEEQLRALGAPELELAFVPVSAPLSRGILAVCTTEVPEEWTLEACVERLSEAYARERLVRVPARRGPEVAAVAHSAYAEVGVEVGPVRGGRRTASWLAALDNLIKGGAGQAIQNMNLMLGLPETTALDAPGAFP